MRNCILLIGDISPSAERIQAELLRYGLDVETARTSGSGLSSVQRHIPGAIVLDMDLPNGDTFQLVQALKSDPITANIPVIFVTHCEETSAALSSFQAGAFDYIRKDAFVEHNVIISLHCLNLL
jgi:CheY-like chemotaxis protein